MGEDIPMAAELIGKREGQKFGGRGWGGLDPYGVGLNPYCVRTQSEHSTALRGASTHCSMFHKAIVI